VKLKGKEKDGAYGTGRGTSTVERENIKVEGPPYNKKKAKGKSGRCQFCFR